MLDVTLRDLAFRSLRGVDVSFARNAHTALVGPPAAGTSTLLRLVAGLLRPESGDVIIGQRRVNEVKASHRPLLFVTSSMDVPGRWSVQHALVAAVRTRSLDRIDRRREYELVADKWNLGALLERRVDRLSTTEQARVHAARIELLRPALLLADRVLDRVNPAARLTVADALFRTMRVHGTTVISVPSSHEELAFTDSVAVLDEGRIVQAGSAAEVFARPVTEGAAIAMGDVDVVPVTVRGNVVESVIGSWDVSDPRFQGSGVALVRPSHFSAAGPGEESDFVFGVEEAGFAGGQWIARGVLSGGITIRVALPAHAAVHKGKLMALRYDPSQFTLLPRAHTPLQTTVPTDVVPPMSETR